MLAKSKDFMENSIKDIVESSISGIKVAECRNI